MAQQAPSKGNDLVWPWAFEDLRLFVQEARPDLDGSLENLTHRLTERVETGAEKYGTYLMTHNGRDALQDAWEEAADLQFYLAQAAMEMQDEENVNVDGRAALYEVQELAQECLLLLDRFRGTHGR